MTDLIVDGGTLAMDDSFLERQRLGQPLGINVSVDLKGLIQLIVVSPVAKPFVEELVRTLTKRRDLEHVVRRSDLLKSPVY